MEFSSDWKTMFSKCPESSTAPRLGIDYVAASAPVASLGSLTVQQDLSGLGIAGVVWNCARVLIDFLQQEPKRLRGRRVVELGTGTGAVGLAVAVTASPLEVILSDLPNVVTELTQRNLEMAVETHEVLRAMATEGKLRAVEHTWGSTMNIALLQDCDSVLCSDCLYEPRSFDALLETMRLISPQEIYIAYKQRHPERERAFFHAASAWFHRKTDANQDSTQPTEQSMRSTPLG